MRFHPLLSLPSYAALMLALSLTAQAQTTTSPLVTSTSSVSTDASLCATSEDYLQCLEDTAIRETPECADPYSISCQSAREARALALDGVAERHGRRLCFLSGWPTCFIDDYSAAEMEADDEKSYYGITYRYLGLTPDRRMAIIERDASAYEVFETLFITVGPHTSDERLRFSADPAMQLSFSPDRHWMLAISTSSGYDGDEHATGISVYELSPLPTERNAGISMQSLFAYDSTELADELTREHPELPPFPLREPSTMHSIFGCPLYEQEAGNKKYHILWHGSDRVEIRGQTSPTKTPGWEAPSHAVVILQRAGDTWYISEAQGDTPPRPAKDSDYDPWRMNGSCLDMIQTPQAPIGSAAMLTDGTLVLDLTAQTTDGATTGHAQFRYAPGAPEYDRILAHLGGLEPGQSKLVPPWPQKETEPVD